MATISQQFALEYSCAMGWDVVTGLGSPNVNNMLSYLRSILVCGSFVPASLTVFRSSTYAANAVADASSVLCYPTQAGILFLSPISVVQLNLSSTNTLVVPALSVICCRKPLSRAMSA